MQEASSVRSFNVLHTLLSVRHFPYQEVSASYDMDEWNGAALPLPDTPRAGGRHPLCWWQTPLELRARMHVLSQSVCRIKQAGGWNLAVKQVISAEIREGERCPGFHTSHCILL